MTATEQKIKLAREKSIEWIEYLATKSDKNLERRLRINHKQYAIAVKEKLEDVRELLNIMERIIIEARIYKSEHSLPDSLNAIEIAIADVETVIVKSGERKEILNDHANVSKQVPDKIQDDNDSQLSLF